MNFIVLRLKKALNITKISLLSIALLTMQQTIYSKDDNAQWPKKSTSEFVYNREITRDKIKNNQDRQDIDTTPTIEITQHLFDYGITRTKTTKAHKYHQVIQTTTETWTTKNPVSRVWNNGTMILGISGTTALMYIKQLAEIQDNLLSEPAYLEEEFQRLLDEEKVHLADINRLQSELNNSMQEANKVEDIKLHIADAIQTKLALMQEDNADTSDENEQEQAPSAENNAAEKEDQASENNNSDATSDVTNDANTTEESTSDENSSQEALQEVSDESDKASDQNDAQAKTNPVVAAPAAQPTPAVVQVPALVVTPASAEQTQKIEAEPATTNPVPAPVIAPAPITAPAITPVATPTPAEQTPKVENIPAVAAPIVTPAPVVAPVTPPALEQTTKTEATPAATPAPIAAPAITPAAVPVPAVITPVSAPAPATADVQAKKALETVVASPVA